MALKAQEYQVLKAKATKALGTRLEPHTMECKSISFVTNRLPYLYGAFKFFFQQFPRVLQL